MQHGINDVIYQSEVCRRQRMIPTSGHRFSKLNLRAPLRIMILRSLLVLSVESSLSEGTRGPIGGKLVNGWQRTFTVMLVSMGGANRSPTVDPFEYLSHR